LELSQQELTYQDSVDVRNTDYRRGISKTTRQNEPKASYKYLKKHEQKRQIEGLLTHATAIINAENLRGPVLIASLQ
jgi:hypothetical protein